MRDLKRIRSRFITSAIVLGLISAGLVAYLLWPASSGPTPAGLQEQYATLKKEVALWKKGNPATVRSDLSRFYSDEVPARYSEISQRMEKLIQASGVSAPGIQYSVSAEKQNKASLPGVQEVEINTTVSGDYSKVARFINALEQDNTFFIVDKISLSGHEAGTVSLTITVDTFLRSA